MNRRRSVTNRTAIACTFAAACASVAQPTTTRPSAPPSTTTVPASAPTSSGSAAIDALLDRLETKGRVIQGLFTRIEYHDIRVEPVEDVILKRGELLFRRLEPNSKFLITFHETVAGGIKTASREDYLFDGVWFTERSERARTVIRRQMVREGTQIDPFKLGAGPFPLPFGQTRADMVRNFIISLDPPRAGDPPATDHLHCIPRATSDVARTYTRVEMFIDRRLELPVRLEVERVSDGNRIRVDFTDLNPNESPAASRFQIDAPGPDWDTRVEPLPPEPAIPPPGGGVNAR